jgi:hypothetical protein
MVGGGASLESCCCGQAPQFSSSTTHPAREVRSSGSDTTQLHRIPQAVAGHLSHVHACRQVPVTLSHGLEIGNGKWEMGNGKDDGNRQSQNGRWPIANGPGVASQSGRRTLTSTPLSSGNFHSRLPICHFPFPIYSERSARSGSMRLARLAGRTHAIPPASRSRAPTTT